jgi:hypothetical protein
MSQCMYSVAPNELLIIDGSYLVHELLERVHGGGRQTEEHVDALPLLAVREEEDDLLLRQCDGSRHDGLAPAEVGAVEGEARPHGDEQRGRQRRPRPRRLEVVHRGAHVLVGDHAHGLLHQPRRARSRRGQQLAGGGQRVGQHDAVPEVPLRQRRREAAAPVDGEQQLRALLGGQPQRGGARAPDQAGERLEGRAPVERAVGERQAAHALEAVRVEAEGAVEEVVAVVERRRVGDVGDLGELVVGKGDHRRVARLEDGAVQERRHGELRDAAGRLGPRVHELHGADAVEHAVVHGQAQREAAALEPRHLRAESEESTTVIS